MGGAESAKPSGNPQFQAFNWRTSACTALVCPSSLPELISACTTHPRSISPPMLCCLAAAAIVFTVERYPAQCSSTGRTALLGGREQSSLT